MIRKTRDKLKPATDINRKKKINTMNKNGRKKENNSFGNAVPI